MDERISCEQRLRLQLGNSAPSKALNARSTFQLLALRTALMTARSIEGKASFKVFSDCSLGLKGLGGFGGADGGVSVVFCEACWPEGALLLVVITPDS